MTEPQRHLTLRCFSLQLSRSDCIQSFRAFCRLLVSVNFVSVSSPLVTPPPTSSRASPSQCLRFKTLVSLLVLRLNFSSRLRGSILLSLFASSNLPLALRETSSAPAFSRSMVPQLVKLLCMGLLELPLQLAQPGDEINQTRGRSGILDRGDHSLRCIVYPRCLPGVTLYRRA